MNVDVSVDGRPWRVSVDPVEGARVRVSVKGRQRMFDVARIDAGTLSLIDVDSAKVYEIGIEELDGDQWFKVQGSRFRVQAQNARTRTRTLHPEPGTLNPGGRVNVAAPMPGRVVRVLVKPGDRVRARQGVVVVEAMKMENELRAPKDGVVAEVKVAEGTAVEKGAVLVVVD